MDRIERHDVVNAVMLAVVLLLFGFAILTAFSSLASTVDEGIVTSTKEPDADEEPPAGATSSTVPDEVEEDVANLADPRPPGEVTVRVANGARRQGVAGAGTATLEAAGYPALDPKNGPTVDDSVVYYVSGYAADAAAVAELLGLQATAIEPMPDEPGVPIDGAHVIALLGVNSDF